MEELPKWKHDLPAFPHKLIDEPLQVVVHFYLEHLERDAREGKLAPVKYWIVCRGLLLGAMQSYASICILLSAKRPKPLMLQAGVLNRSLFETLTNITALVEDPTRIEILEREAFKSMALKYSDLKQRFGSQEKWKEYLDVYAQSLELIAKQVGLSAEAVASPGSIAADWPTPGRLIFGRPNQKIAPWVSGDRQEVLKRLYQSNYPHQSELAHQRIAAVSAAMLVDNPEAQWNPGHGESGIVVDAAATVACIVAELQAVGGYAKHSKLAELWAYLRELDDDVAELWDLRYKELVAG